MISPQKNKKAMRQDIPTAIDTFFFSLYHLLYTSFFNYLLLFPFLQLCLIILVIIAKHSLLNDHFESRWIPLGFREISSKVETKVAFKKKHIARSDQETTVKEKN